MYRISLFIVSCLICVNAQYSESQKDSLKIIYERKYGSRDKTGKTYSGIEYRERSEEEIGREPLTPEEDTIDFVEINIDSLKEVELKIESEEFDELKEVKKYRVRIPVKEVELKPFGFDYFKPIDRPSPIEEYGPVDPGYVIGIGDEVVIIVWGQVEFTQSLNVNRIGTISVKGIGQVKAAGLPLKELKKKLVNRLSKVYSGIRYGRSNAKTFVDVSIGRLRTKKVFIVGDVKNPGAYNVSAMSTVLNALMYAGGPLEKGSLRKINVKRDGKIVKTVDCYDYFIKGDKSADVTLVDYDIILVPPACKRVSIQGAVHRQAIFELKDDETLETLLEYCGGLEPEAYIENFNIVRTLKNKERITVTIKDPVGKIERGEKIDLFDKDKIVITTIDEKSSTVSIEGAVLRPGEYEFTPDMKLKDVIQLAGGVNPDGYTPRAEIIRTYDDLTSDIIAVNVGAALEGNNEENIDLQKWDVIKIFSEWDLKTKEYVFIKGHVKNPGKYLLRNNMTVQDIVLFAGGFTKYALRDTIEVSRIDINDKSVDKKAEVFKIPAKEDFLKKESGNSFLLKHMDNVFVRRNVNYREQAVIKLTGEFNFPGYYAKKYDNERLSSLLTRAGGIRKTAYLEGAKFTRQKNSVGTVALDIEQILKNKSRKEDIILEDGDELFLPTVPKTVKVSGLVGLATSVKFVEGKGVDYYVEKAGGFSQNADRRYTYVVLANGQVGTRKGIKRTYVNAGSEIIVPKKPEEEERDWLGMSRNLIAILASIITIIVILNTLNK